MPKKHEPKKELWKKEDMQRRNRIQAHRKTVQDKRASLNQVAVDPEPTQRVMRKAGPVKWISHKYS